MSRPLGSRTAFVGVSIVFAAFFLAGGAPTPLLSLRQEQWGFSAGILTIAFSVYAVALLVALLVGGSLSDHTGRRPVLLASLGGELVSMVVFLVAPSIGWVIAARALQGLATGLATSAFNASIAEHAPAHLKKLAGGLAGASVAGGLGLGALLAGTAVQFTRDANTIVFAVLTAMMVLGIVLVALTPETSVKRPGAARSLTPRIVLPAHLRRDYVAGIPVHIAGWMFPAFFLGLSPSILRLQFGYDGGLVAGFTAFVGPFTSAVAGFVFARFAPRRGTIVGLGLLLAGMLVVLTAVTTTTLPLLWVGGLLGGAGFGGTFGGQLRLIAPRVADHERAGVFAGVYTAAYLSFGLPVVIAGQLAPRWGILPTFEAYAAAVLLFAVVGLVAQSVIARREAAGRAIAATAA
ncbi:MFS transporter [Leifsonia shinshuensis]|uniref:MFS transporter n=1 Tax=Leifsonia shinshuensis TaxID=150026 RepID=UPI00285DD01C|nr:MFS transporter [Leifsonia shinshuensis]MDR6972771.1 MFS family permease [Leifsonia shinshuensis]